MTIARKRVSTKAVVAPKQVPKKVAEFAQEKATKKEVIKEDTSTSTKRGSVLVSIHIVEIAGTKVQLVTLKGLSSLLGYETSTIRNWLSRGLFPEANMRKPDTQIKGAIDQSKFQTKLYEVSETGEVYRKGTRLYSLSLAVSLSAIFEQGTVHDAHVQEQIKDAFIKEKAKLYVNGKKKKHSDSAE
jgi:hypothetical protein